MENTIEQENKSKPEIQPYLKQTYEIYCLWKSLPALFKFPPADKNGNRPTPSDFAQQLGIDDEQIIELVNIRTQTEFGEKYNVFKDTMTAWNKSIKARNSLGDLRMWARGLSKNVITSLYNTAVKKGSALEVKLWFQLIESWEEKGRVEHDMGNITFNVIVKKNGDQSGIIGETDARLGTTAQ